LAAALGLLVAAEALATPVAWTVVGSFDDGGDLNGTFIYDADSDGYSDISLKTSAGSRDSPFFGAAYDSVDPSTSSADALFAAAATTLLELIYGDSLSNQGGVVALASGVETLTSGPDQGAVRSLTGGQAVGVPVPEPSSLSLAALGLSALAAVRRLRR
jgi:hypothetical protein